MASALFDKGREGFLDGSLDWDTDDVRADPVLGERRGDETFWRSFDPDAPLPVLTKETLRRGLGLDNATITDVKVEHTIDFGCEPIRPLPEGLVLTAAGILLRKHQEINEREATREALELEAEEREAADWRAGVTSEASCERSELERPEQ